MSLESVAYTQSIFGLYLCVLCVYLFYDYYRNAYKSTTRPKGQLSTALVSLFCFLTLFTFLASFFIAFLYNNAFHFVDADTIAGSTRYCKQVMDVTILWFYFHSMTIWIILSYSIDNTLRRQNNNGAVYNFMSHHFIWYRGIVVVAHIYLAVHVIIFMHSPTNIEFNIEWRNYESAFVLCELASIASGVHVAVLSVVQALLYALAITPLLRRYSVLLADHKNQKRADQNEDSVEHIKLVVFYCCVGAIFDIIFFAIFLTRPRVAAFTLIVILFAKTCCIYVLSTDTLSHRYLCACPRVVFLAIWNRVSPLNDPVPTDPSYRWYHKHKESLQALYGPDFEAAQAARNAFPNVRPFSPHKSKTSTRPLQLSAGNLKIPDAENEHDNADGDIAPDDDFAEENSITITLVTAVEEAIAADNEAPTEVDKLKSDDAEENVENAEEAQLQVAEP